MPSTTVKNIGEKAIRVKIGPTSPPKDKSFLKNAQKLLKEQEVSLTYDKGDDVWIGPSAGTGVSDIASKIISGSKTDVKWPQF